MNIPTKLGCAILFLSGVFPAPVVQAQSGAKPKQVLLLYWADQNHPANLSFENGLRATLQSLAPGGFEYYAEYMEPVRFPGEKQSELLRDYILQKYAGRPMDVIVAPNSVSLDFLLKYRRELFPDTPVVFAATQDPDPAQLRLGAGATGVLYVTSYRITVELALKLHPGAER